MMNKPRGIVIDIKGEDHELAKKIIDGTVDSIPCITVKGIVTDSESTHYNGTFGTTTGHLYVLENATLHINLRPVGPANGMYVIVHYPEKLDGIEIGDELDVHVPCVMCSFNYDGVSMEIRFTRVNFMKACGGSHADD